MTAVQKTGDPRNCGNKPVYKFAWLKFLMISSCLCMLLLSLQATAERYALLVGISAYPSLGTKLQLHGPQNDVVLVRSLLKNAGFAGRHIRTLANGVAGVDGEPTRRAILGELETLAQRARRGDYVYVQFSGHGSQQPTRPGKTQSELDGLDEIFIPVDVGQWDGSIGAVRNAIRDDEIGAAIDAIRARGAFVWGVFDTCHSGNITRGARDGETRERRIDPIALGVPQSVLDRAQDHAGAMRTRGGATSAKNVLESDDGLEGGYVYFYAAQTTEIAPEKPLPENDPYSQTYGLFTYTLAQVIASSPGISYRQAGERVLQIYAARNMHVTPMFEGSAIDAPVFGQKIGDTVRQWRVIRAKGGLEIEAGYLQQFGTGAIFGVFGNTAARRDAEPIGYLRADKVEVMRTMLSPVVYNGKPALGKLPEDAVARLVKPNIALSLRVALPPAVPQDEEGALVKRAIGKLRRNGDGLKIEWVPDGKPADVRLVVADNQLWLVSSDGVWVRQGDEKTPSIRLDKSTQELQSVLADTLQRIAKATNLYRMAASHSNRSAEEGGIETSFYVIHMQDGKREEIKAAEVPVTQKGDHLQLTVRNNSVKDVDITVLGIDAHHGISLLYPPSGNDANRMHPRDVLTIPPVGKQIVLDGSTTGTESILVIAVEAEKNNPVNLGFLKQSSLNMTRSARQGSNTAVEGLFERVGFGDTKKSQRAPDDRGRAMEKTMFKVYRYRTYAER